MDSPSPLPPAARGRRGGRGGVAAGRGQRGVVAGPATASGKRRPGHAGSHQGQYGDQRGDQAAARTPRVVVGVQRVQRVGRVDRIGRLGGDHRAHLGTSDGPVHGLFLVIMLGQPVTNL